MANLEQSGRQPTNAWSADITKIKEVPVLEGIYSERRYVCVITYQNF